ncbi:MAG: hypothetical protein RLY31_1339 [Bacteroidota bacterium]|jgi:exopolyphosphatase/guanosine-5'-triphosphate,3'-diphosphate pyrophosphatase
MAGRTEKKAHMRAGIIDCGTNTFHLLVAEWAEGGTCFEVLHRQREYVWLGESGLDWIGREAFDRGVACLERFRGEMERNGVVQCLAFGTEALRRAGNGPAFVAAAEAATGLTVRMISGLEEAHLIHRGVMQAVPPFEGKALIMDIGGGSVEFIICDATKVFWARSFPIGLQVLHKGFQHNDPISAGDLAALEHHLDSVLAPLLEALQIHETPWLLGASGSFEVLEAFLVPVRQHELFSIIPVSSYGPLHHRLLRMNAAERQRLPALPPERVRLIVVALVLMEFVIRRAGIREIITSAYAIKEGMLAELMEGRLA